MCDRVETQTNVIESAFQDYTERKDIAILLINQHVSPTLLPTTHRYPMLDIFRMRSIGMILVRVHPLRYLDCREDTPSC